LSARVIALVEAGVRRARRSDGHSAKRCSARRSFSPLGTMIYTAWGKDGRANTLIGGEGPPQIQDEEIWTIEAKTREEHPHEPIIGFGLVSARRSDAAELLWRSHCSAGLRTLARQRRPHLLDRFQYPGW
jgi:hypothetical protein